MRGEQREKRARSEATKRYEYSSYSLRSSLTLRSSQIDAGLETPEERKLRKTMEKNKRRKERATARAAKAALKKELRKRGMKSMVDRASRDSKMRDTRDTRATQEGSLSALLASAKAEVEQDIEKGVDFEDSLEYKPPVAGDDDASLDSAGKVRESESHGV